MGKRGGRRIFQKDKKDTKDAKTSSRYRKHGFSNDDMDDIDAFHKQRDLIPLDINDDVGISGDDHDTNDNVAKMIRQRKYLHAKFGNGEDDIYDDDDEDEEDYKLTLGGKKFSYGAENRNFELQWSDDEALKEEEELALRIQREKVKSYTLEDYELEDMFELNDDGKIILKGASDRGEGTIKSPYRDMTSAFEDQNALSKEEQMNVLHRSAPELVGLLSELKEAHEELECKINPFLSKVKNGEIIVEGGVQYFELKQLLLLCYCQAITFYLLLKSEWLQVHDHPVMARIEEIKNLLDQAKQLDTKLPFKLEDILKGNNVLETVGKSDDENAPRTTDSYTKIQEQSPASSKAAVLHKIQKVESLKYNVQKASKDKHQNHISVRLQMLKVRVSLEKKLKQKGLCNSDEGLKSRDQLQGCKD